MVLKPPSFGTCLVCDSPAHGYHFGVNTCRACAAFFRRLYVTKKQNFKCHTLEDICTAIDGKWVCKKCRVKKCLDVGMKPDRIQYDRDLISTSIEDVDICDEEPPEITIPCSVERKSSKEKCIPDGINSFTSNVDLSILLDKLPIILNKAPTLTDKSKTLSSLEKLAYGLRDIRRRQTSEKYAVMKLLDLNGMYEYWKEELTISGEFFSYFDEFQQLEYNDKMTMFSNMWLIFTKLQSAVLTAEMRVNQLCENNCYVFTKGSIIDYNDFTMATDWLSFYSNEEVKQYMGPYTEWFDEKLVQIAIELQPNDVELSYIICCLSLQLTAKRFRGKYEEISDRLQSILSDSLHEYYSRNSETMQYSHRLVRLLSINRSYQQSVLRHREKLTLGRILKIFNVKFSHPDFVGHFG